MPTPLTTKEKAAISALKQLAKTWPKSLWLFSASGSLHVMKFNPDGSRVETRTGGTQPDAVVASITGIPNDGGDW